MPITNHDYPRLPKIPAVGSAISQDSPLPDIVLDINQVNQVSLTPATDPHWVRGAYVLFVEVQLPHDLYVAVQECPIVTTCFSRISAPGRDLHVNRAFDCFLNHSACKCISFITDDWMGWRSRRVYDPPRTVPHAKVGARILITCE